MIKNRRRIQFPYRFLFLYGENAGKKTYRDKACLVSTIIKIFPCEDIFLFITKNHFILLRIFINL